MCAVKMFKEIFLMQSISPRINGHINQMRVMHQIINNCQWEHIKKQRNVTVKGKII